MWQNKYREWLKNCAREGRAELLAIADNMQEVQERFDGEIQFGTAGMRGLLGYGTNYINIHTIGRATQGLAQYICSLGEIAKEQGVAIAYDTRAYSYTFAKIAAMVLAKNQIKSYLYSQPQPVPILSYTVQKLNTVAGIMITASHNPKQYNGYKVYNSSGSQMSIEQTAKIVREIEKVDYFSPLQSIEKNKHYILKVPNSVLVEYYTYLQTLAISPKRQESKVKLVYTPLHGTGKDHVEKLLTAKGLQLITVLKQAMPDANFSTVKVPNPEITESLQLAIDLAKKIQANAVFATDPDADRLGVALQREDGEFIPLTGNQIGLLLLNYILESKHKAGQLPNNGIVVKSFVSSPLAKRICKQYGVEVIDVPVGFKFIGEKIEECSQTGKSFLFGFEESCGYLYGTAGSKDKDAILAATLFAELACSVEKEGLTLYKKLQNIYKQYGYALDKTENIAFLGLAGMEKMTKALDKMRAEKFDIITSIPVDALYDYATATKYLPNRSMQPLDTPKHNALYFELSTGGFVAIRPSGTEPKLKIYYSIMAAEKTEAERVQVQLEKELKNFFENI